MIMSEQEKHEKFLELLKENEYENPVMAMKIYYDMKNDIEISKKMKDPLFSFINHWRNDYIYENIGNEYDAGLRYVDEIIKMFKRHNNIIINDRERTIINRLVFMAMADWKIRHEIEYTKRYYDNDCHLNHNRPATKPKQEFKKLKQVMLF